MWGWRSKGGSFSNMGGGTCPVRIDEGVTYCPAHFKLAVQRVRALSDKTVVVESDAYEEMRRKVIAKMDKDKELLDA
jgi:hypothetical protein